LARLLGAACSGIDVSARLVAVARDRNPDCDIRVGYMHALPWDPASFAYEAIQNVGEDEFHRAAVEQAQGQLRDGLPLRASINVVGYLARKPEGAQAE
jgi:hypothetical protein